MIKYFIFFSVLISGVPLGYYLSKINIKFEKVIFFLSIFFTCNMIDINFVSRENYRGTTRGFEVGLVDITLIILTCLIYSRSHLYKIIIWPQGSTLYLIYFLISCLSIVNAGIGLYSAFEVLTMLRMYFFYWVMVNYIRELEQLYLLMKIFAIITIYVFLQVMHQKYLLGIFQTYGPFPHQNSMVMYMSILGSLLLSYSINEHRTKLIIWGVIFLMTAFCIISSLSRAGLVLFIFNCSLILFFSFVTRSRIRTIKKKKLLVIFSIPIIVMLVLIKAWDTISERFNTAPKESAETRVILAEAAIKMANDKTLGIGLNNFGLKINDPYPYNNHFPEKTLRNEKTGGLVETIYLMIAAETGWFNLFIFLCFIFNFYFSNLRNYLYYKKTSINFISIAFIGGLSSIYVQSTLEWVLKQTNNYYQLMLVFAIIATLTRWRKHKRVVI